VSRYVSYSICRPKNTHAAEATPRNTVNPQLVDTLALTLDSTALNTASVAAAAFDPNSNVRLSADNREVEAGRDDDMNRVDRNVLSPNSAMNMRHRDEKNDETNDTDVEDMNEGRREDDDEAMEDEREDEEEEAAVVMAVRLCSAESMAVAAMEMKGAEDGKTSDECMVDECMVDECMVVKRRARGTTEAETSNGL